MYYNTTLMRHHYYKKKNVTLNINNDITMEIRPITIQKTSLDTLMLIMFSGRKAREGTYVSIKCVHTTHIQHHHPLPHTHFS